MAATVLDSLRGVSMYPIPQRTLDELAARWGLALDGEATQEVLRGKAFNLALAALLLWLSFAPDITQGGQSYSFTDEQRLQLRNRARALQDQFMDEEEAQQNKPVYGYKGSRL